MQQIYQCPFCRGSVGPGAAFCPNCGGRFSQPAPPPVVPPGYSAPPTPQYQAPQYYVPPQKQPSLGGSITQGFGWGCGCLLIIPTIFLILLILANMGAHH
jgi:hypothetical protein